MNQRNGSFAAFAVLLIIGMVWFGWGIAWGGATSAERAESAGSDQLTIVWTSGDPDVAHRMTLMYTNGAHRNGWFDDVTLVIWGPSQRLVVGDKDIRDKITQLMERGVNVKACLACADSYGIAEDLRGHDIEVKYMGKPLSDDIKSGRHVITF